MSLKDKFIITIFAILIVSISICGKSEATTYNLEEQSSFESFVLNAVKGDSATVKPMGAGNGVRKNQWGWFCSKSATDEQGTNDPINYTVQNVMSITGNKIGLYGKQYEDYNKMNGLLAYTIFNGDGAMQEYWKENKKIHVYQIGQFAFWRATSGTNGWIKYAYDNKYLTGDLWNNTNDDGLASLKEIEKPGNEQYSYYKYLYDRYYVPNYSPWIIKAGNAYSDYMDKIYNTSYSSSTQYEAPEEITVTSYKNEYSNAKEGDENAEYKQSFVGGWRNITNQDSLASINNFQNSPKISINKNYTVTENSNNYVIGPIKIKYIRVSTNNYNDTHYSEVSEKDVSGSKAISFGDIEDIKLYNNGTLVSGTSIVDKDGNTIKTTEIVSDSTEVYIKTSNKDVVLQNVSIGIQQKHTFYSANVIALYPPIINGKLYNAQTYMVGTGMKREFVMENTFNLNLKGSLKIIKVDKDNNNRLNGAVFNIKSEDGTFDKDVTITTNGEITVTDIPVGKVTVTEKQAPDGYSIDTATQSTTVSEGSTVSLTFKDTRQTGSLKIIKVDKDNNNRLNGAVFNIKSEDGTFDKDVTITTNGEITVTDIPVGKVTVTEKQAPDGYSIDTATQSTTVSEGSTVSITFKDTKQEEPTGSLKIIKVDKDNNNRLNGAVFNVKSEDGTFDKDVTITSNGEIIVTGIPVGKVTVTEKQAPEGYNIDTATQSTTVSEGSTVSITFKDTKQEEPTGSLKIIKVDKDNNNRLNGAVFNVKSEDGTFDKDVTITSNGEITVTGIPVGKVTVTEKQAPEGYNIDTATQSTTVSNGSTVSITFKDTRQTGSLKIIKVDKDTNNKLNGAIFNVKSEDGTFDKDVTITADGEITVTGIPVGKVTVTEKQAPEGYNIDTATQTVTVSETTTASITFKDTRQTGSLKIIKVNSKTNERLNGAVFNIKSEDGRFDKDVTITANGEITVTGIPVGKVTVTEKQAPEGYNIDTATQSTTVSEGSTVSLTFKDTRKIGNLKIIKVDSETNEKLNGAVFNIKSEDGTFDKDVTITADGEITVTEIPVGKVTVTEKQAPTRYNIDTEVQSITVSEGTTVSLTFKDTKQKGSLKIVKVDSKDNSVKLNGAVFNIKSEDGSFNEDVTVNGEMTVEDIPVGKVTVTEKSAPTNYKIDTKSKEVTIIENKVTDVTFKDILETGNIKFLKVIKGTQTPLANFEFKITPKNVSLQDQKLHNVYQTTRTFTTDSSGKATLTDLPLGTYTVTEIKVGNKYFKEGETWEVTISKDAQTVEITMENEPEFTDISGYVWKDYIAGKKSEKNDLYDNGEEKLANIVVILKNGDTEIARTNTDSNGEYKFNLVLIETINNSNCKIEFIYNGLVYEAVTPNISKDISNASRAKEDGALRAETNKKYSTEENGNATKDFNMTANTKDAGCKLADYIEVITENDIKVEIRNMNLGLGEREQPDLAILKDVVKSQVSINGKTYTYNYADRFKKPEELEKSDWTVEFKNKFTKEYSQPIYPSDVEYEGSDELKVYVIYKIAVKNESTSLKARINSIVDYYDSSYGVPVQIGNKLNENEIVNVDSSVSYQSNNGEITVNGDTYRKLVIQPNQTYLDPQTIDDGIYVKFELSRTVINDILNSGEGLDNIVEINSVTYFDENRNPYAGRDKNSIPGNYNPANQGPVEDDTDTAPLFKLQNAGERTVKGTVFEDNDGVSPETRAGEERKGDGTYNPNVEPGINNVEIYLVDSETNAVIQGPIQTTNGGEYTIRGFIPGDYKIKYVWGDAPYNVLDYKGTIYPESSRQENNKWYQENIDTRYTDALDNYQTRTDIDNQVQDITNATYENEWNTDGKKMDSYTPKMLIDIENTKATEMDRGSTNALPGYTIQNVDFGIIERPRQTIAVDKSISNVKLSLGNGQQIVNANLDENGNFIDESGNVITEMKYIRTLGDAGIVIEMDSELIQSSILKAEYKMKVKNISEKDYASQDYYLYGTDTNEEKLMTITASEMIDYLDKGWNIDNSTNLSDWEIKEKSYLNGLVKDEVYSSDVINKRAILSTTALAGEKIPVNDSSRELTLSVSKYLSNQDEIDLRNDLEIVKVHTETGRKLYEEIIGNYIPVDSGTADDGSPIGNGEPDDDRAAPISIIPNTGENGNENIIIISMSIAVLVILATGIIAIKKKVLNK